MEEMEVEEFEDPSSERVLTWGTPQLIHFNRIFYYKPDILGNPIYE
jgi:hypothetical protein